MNPINFSFVLLINSLSIVIAYYSGVQGILQSYLSYLLLASLLFQLLVVLFLYGSTNKNEKRVEKQFNDIIRAVKTEHGNLVLTFIRLVSGVYCFKLTNNTLWLSLPIVSYSIVPVINIKDLYFKKNQK